MALFHAAYPPRLLSSIRHEYRNNIFIRVSHQRFHFAANTRIQLVLSTPAFSSRRILVSPPKSSPISGVSVQNDIDTLNEGHREDKENVEFLERLRRWVGFLPSILPGGSWWDFSDDAEVQVSAKPVTVWRALTKMWELVAQDRWVIFAAFSTLILAAVSEISIPHFLTASIFSAQGAEIAVFRRNVRLLVLLCITSGICSGIRGCCFGIANMILFITSSCFLHLVKRMRETLYSSLLLQDISFFDSETVGDLTSRLGADCQQVSRVIGNDLNMIFRNILQGTGALIYLLILSWPLGLSTLIICTVLSAVMLHYGRYQKKAAKLIQEVTASANEVAQETFSLIRTVRVHGTEREELGRYKWWLRKLADISLRQSAAYGFWNFSFNTLYHSTQVIAVLFGGMSILAGVKLQRLMGHVEFINVSFHYPSRPSASVVQYVSFVVHPGEVVAIVGLSGSGKSTLVNLLLRLYEPTNGQILIDGYPLKELDITWWRERIGYVGQEPKLFRMDISSNIRYGCTRDIKQEDVEWAAKQAYAHDFISALPNGYETLVDNDLLSGGQKQRIAIARAILRDPTILVLDEATSALDAESEYNVKGVLRSVRGDSSPRRSVVVIAHRLSTIQAADRIMVMDGGQVVEHIIHSYELLPVESYESVALYKLGLLEHSERKPRRKGGIGAKASPEFSLLVHEGGQKELYEHAVPASKLMDKYPGMCVALPQVFKDPHQSVLWPEEILLPGHKYIIISCKAVEKLKRKYPEETKTLLENQVDENGTIIQVPNVHEIFEASPRKTQEENRVNVEESICMDNWELRPRRKGIKGKKPFVPPLPKEKSFRNLGWHPSLCTVEELSL
ncbi:ABC transporter B family member 26, chloroplastic isoform X1 [Senna tora]|uniref:ABC transporter B family member 26, chloroplastic isoform X1 n=1 Tax=Senna tora TaxID=362788 RepID=A0A834WRH2_9FABA|nr:ABC transporter B family member 26, chloroplastic isoform X1 [Senna tora]